MFLLYGFTGSTNFEVIASQLNKENEGAVFAMVFILVGLAFKVSASHFICGHLMFMREPQHQ